MIWQASGTVIIAKDWERLVTGILSSVYTTLSHHDTMYTDLTVFGFDLYHSIQIYSYAVSVLHQITRKIPPLRKFGLIVFYTDLVAVYLMVTVSYAFVITSLILFYNV